MLETLINDYNSVIKHDVNNNAENSKGETSDAIKAEMFNLFNKLNDVLFQYGIKGRETILESIIAEELYLPLDKGFRGEINEILDDMLDLNTVIANKYMEVLDNNDYSEEVVSSSKENIKYVENNHDKYNNKSTLVEDKYKEVTNTMIRQLSLNDEEVIYRVKKVFNDSSLIVEEVTTFYKEQFIVSSKNSNVDYLANITEQLELQSVNVIDEVVPALNNVGFLKELYDNNFSELRESKYAKVTAMLDKNIDSRAYELLSVVNNVVSDIGIDVEKNVEFIGKLATDRKKEMAATVSSEKNKNKLFDDNYFDNIKNKTSINPLRVEEETKDKNSFKDFTNSLFSYYNLSEDKKITLMEAVMLCDDKLNETEQDNLKVVNISLDDNRTSKANATEAILEFVEMNDDNPNLKQSEISDMVGKVNGSTTNKVVNNTLESKFK